MFNFFFSMLKVTKKNTKILFYSDSQNLNIIPKGIDTVVHFRFRNIGNHDLIIEKIKTGCSCTLTEFTTGKIAVNKEGLIKVNYKSNSFGNFKKSIFVYYNGENSPYYLTITGKVDLLK